jgi:TetR/AcrR family transcriptional regulator, mexCD-oprJ operon repressor
MSMPTPTGARRADARRNIDAILDAATSCLGRQPDASIDEIARAAGVGRVTLYNHFSSRAQLVDAVLTRAIARGNEALSSVNLTGDPLGALERLINASWHEVDRARRLLHAAQRELSPARIRELHDEPAARAEELVTRGRAEGVFRTDLPTPWLVALLHNVMHGAADEIHAGRLDPDRAADYIYATVVAAYTPPGDVVPGAV